MLCYKVAEYACLLKEAFLEQLSIQVRMLSADFDLMKKAKSAAPNELTPSGNLLKRQFIFPFLLCFIAIAHGLVGMDENVQIEQLLSLQYYRNSPYLFYHFYHPRSSWQQSGNILVSTIVQTLATYGIFALYYNPTGRQLMVLQSGGNDIVQNGRRLNHKVTKQLLRCDHKWTRRILVISTVFLGNSFMFAYPKTVKYAYFTLNFRQTIFWFILYPPLVLYYTYGKCLPLVDRDPQFPYVWSTDFFLLGNLFINNFIFSLFTAVASVFLFSIKNLEYILLKQRFILRRISLSKSWFHFMLHNRDYATLCQEIQDYNQLWSGYVSLNFVMVIGKVCIQAYILLFFRSKQDRIVTNYLIYPTYYWCSIMLFTLKCASIERNNRRILRQNRRYYLRLASSVRSGPVETLLKAEELQQCRRLCHFGIKIFSHYAVTSRTFSEIISYVSLIFLYLVELYRKPEPE